METIRYCISKWFTFLSIFAVTFVHSESHYFFWKKDWQFNDKLVNLSAIADVGTTEVRSTQSKTRCAVWCSESPQCSSLFYNLASGECRMHSLSFRSPVGTVAAPGFNYYLCDGKEQGQATTEPPSPATTTTSTINTPTTIPTITTPTTTTTTTTTPTTTTPTTTTPTTATPTTTTPTTTILTTTTPTTTTPTTTTPTTTTPTTAPTTTTPSTTHTTAPHCPTAFGYTVEPNCGVCYKIQTVKVNNSVARSGCANEGGRLITLDTPWKLQNIMAILFGNSSYLNHFFLVGASRPFAEWNTLWTASSTDYRWESNLQNLSAVNQYYISGQPDKLYSTENVLGAGVLASKRTNFTHFTTFADLDDTYLDYFLCEAAA